jgi:hypothetical protein
LQGSYITGSYILDELFDHDAQSVINTDNTHARCYDAGKKDLGIIRHIDCDMQGLPHAIAITTDEVMDRKGAHHAFGGCAAKLQ